MNRVGKEKAARIRRPVTVLHGFLTSEAAGGIVLMGVALVALGIANSPLAPAYFAALEFHFLGMSILHWINDALMVVFFLLVGLEIKREMLDGELSTWRRRALPGIAALGGMVVPALIYVLINRRTPETLHGWAIPSATDIAFALGVLALLGSRVPASLKIFLTALAILDDLGAVAIIAVFYTGDLSGPMLGGALVCLIVLALLNRAGVMRLAPYLLVGAVLWLLVLKSGVHATLAGVALALVDPASAHTGQAGGARFAAAHHRTCAAALGRLPDRARSSASPMRASPLPGFRLDALLEPVPLGIALGLFLGKQIGVFSFSLAAVRGGIAALPVHATPLQFYGVALLCGIGFTMSLFIGALAFPGQPALNDASKLGVLAGSFLARSSATRS